ncbi:MAG TPA: hypothetical protein G4N96_05445, partial [Chloroflexi bacterium]|nr:hypothetical protein [Chloroflexota bacterium]
MTKNQPDQQAALEKIRQQLNSLETLRGILPDEQIEEKKAELKRQQAALKGAGIIIQDSLLQAGDNAVVGSTAQKIIAGRDNTYLEKPTFITTGETTPDAAHLRAAYL